MSTSAHATGHRTVNNSNSHNYNSHAHQDHREQILNSLLRVDLSEAMRHYLTRTRRSFPIHYVFDMSDLELFSTQPPPL